MQETIEQARKYAKMLANAYQKQRIIVKLPATTAEHRAKYGLAGEYYGGVAAGELNLWLDDGCSYLESVSPDRQRMAESQAEPAHVAKDER